MRFCKCASESPLALFILLFLLKLQYILVNGCFWDSIIEQQNIKLDTRHTGVIKVFVSI